MTDGVELEEIVEDAPTADDVPAASERIDLLAHYGKLGRTRDEAAFVSMAQRLGAAIAQGLTRYCGHPLYQNANVAGAGNLPAAIADISVAQFEMEGVSDPIYLLIAPVVVERVIAALFGADDGEILAPAPALRPEMTHVDRAVLDRLVAEIEGATATLLRDVPGISFKGRGGKIAQVPAGSFRDITSHIAIHLGCDGIAAEGMEIGFLMPRQAASRVAAGVASMKRTSVERSSWRDRLVAAAMDIELETRAPIAHFHMPLARMLALADGDEVAISPTGSAQLCIDGIPIASGEPGEQHGQRAVRINKLQTSLPAKAG